MLPVLHEVVETAERFFSVALSNPRAYVSQCKLYKSNGRNSFDLLSLKNATFGYGRLAKQLIF